MTIPVAERARRDDRLTDVQVKFLEMNFGEERKLEHNRKVHLATELGLDPKQVAVWFQNRRARLKIKTIEEYLKLKNQRDESIVNKCRLENEVLKLKKRILEAEASRSAQTKEALARLRLTITIISLSVITLAMISCMNMISAIISVTT